MSFAVVLNWNPGPSLRLDRVTCEHSYTYCAIFDDPYPTPTLSRQLCRFQNRMRCFRQIPLGQRSVPLVGFHTNVPAVCSCVPVERCDHTDWPAVEPVVNPVFQLRTSQLSRPTCKHLFHIPTRLARKQTFVGPIRKTAPVSIVRRAPFYVRCGTGLRWDVR